METSQFIDQLAAGKAADASSTLSDILSAKAFEALESRKIEIAKSAFGGVDNSQEESHEESIDDINGVAMADLDVPVQNTADEE